MPPVCRVCQSWFTSLQHSSPSSGSFDEIMKLIKSDVWKPHHREETGVSKITLDLPIIKTCHYFTGF